MTEAERRDRMIRWLDEIKREVEQILVSEYLFWELQKIVIENDKFRDVSGLFTRWIADGFRQSSMMAVRRQVKINDNSISLRGFLEETKKFPEMVSRQHYISLYAGQESYVVQMGEQDFDNVAGAGADRLPANLLAQQIAELSRSAETIEAYADRRVAHFDRREPARPFPTFDDLTAAIKVQEKLVILYWRLLKGSNITTLLPTIIFDWQDVFRFAWKP
jgi:hypothetical protein